MVWSCFCGNELGMLVSVSSSMNKEEYGGVIKWHVTSSVVNSWSRLCVPTQQCSMSSSYTGHSDTVVGGE